jgi:2-oxoglutarate/2-oxoacid ferredoxin oxidoreductase subunit beta
MNALTHSTYLTDKVGPLPFCPGCGHDRVVKAVNEALVQLQPDPTKVVIVTDIGCIGLADRYFSTNAFHGLHGRSITYACGLKLARPELTVVVLKGDGGCGIGGAHLLNVARRNVGITLIVANNFNYGMTGGQHSVTTPTDGITATTPMGNVEGAMDLCRTTAAAGAGWVYRATSHDSDLADRIADAIREPGFAMLDIWEMCTAYYQPRNELKKKDLIDMMDRTGMDHGFIANTPRPEYGASLRAAWASSKARSKSRKTIEPRFNHNVSGQTGIVIAGSAGQKIRSAAATFAQAAMFAGLKATQKDDYPITVMTGHSVTEIIISPEIINYTAIDTPDCFIVISEDGLKKSRAKIAKLGDTCTVYAEETLELPETGAKVVRMPFIKTAKKVNRLSIGTVALASVLAERGLFPTEALETAISTFQKPAIAEVNNKAIEAGKVLVSETGE